MQNKKKIKLDLSGERYIPTHVVAVFAVVQKGNKFLLAKRASNDPQAGGQWSIPGGKVEMEEGWGIVEETIRKEVREEVGLEIEDNFEFIGSEGFRRVSGHHVVGLIFLTKWKSGKAKPLEDHEDVKWVTYEEFKKMKDIPVYMIKRIKSLEKHLRVT